MSNTEAFLVWSLLSSTVSLNIESLVTLCNKWMNTLRAWTSGAPIMRIRGVPLQWPAWYKTGQLQCSPERCGAGQLWRRPGGNKRRTNQPWVKGRAAPETGSSMGRGGIEKIDSLLKQGWWSTSYIHTNSFNPLNAFVVANSRWEGLEAEKWSNLPRITQPVNWPSQVLNLENLNAKPRPHTVLAKVYTALSGYLIGAEWRNKNMWSKANVQNGNLNGLLNC